MDISHTAEELLEFIERLPRRVQQNWLGEIGRGEIFLLSYLYAHGNTACPSMMSEAMQTSTARIAAALNSLERKGLIKRELDEQDHRKKLVYLMPYGIDYIESYRGKALDKVTRLLVELGEEDAENFLRIAKRMLAILQQLTDDQ